MLLENKRLRSRYDPDISYDKANELAYSYTVGDAEQWWAHPCTQELIHRLEGDFAGLLIGVAYGVTIDADNADNTAQNTAKNTGLADAIGDVLSLIEAIRKKETIDVEEETEDNGA